MKNWKRIKQPLSIKDYCKSCQAIAEKNQEMTACVMPFIIFLVALALGFFLFFDRYPFFHDEIINTYKASTGLVFDYALRPVFYFLNYLFYHFFGSSPRSLTIAAVIYYAFTTSLLYSIGQRYFGLLGGLLSSLIFMLMPLIIHLGIRGMPNLPAGLFAVIILYLLSKTFTTSSNKWVSIFMSAIGAMSVIMLATHPTLIGVSIVILLWAFWGLVFKGRYFTIFYPEVLKRSHFAVLLCAFIIAYALLNFLYFYYGEQSHLSWFFAGIRKTNNSVYAGYFQPWYWYFEALLKHGSTINVLVLLLIVYFSIIKLKEKIRLDLSSPSFKFLFSVLILSLILLVSLSLNKWKFDRVMVSFIPFYSLSAGLIMAYITAWLIKNKNGLIYSILAFLLIAFIVVKGAISLYDYSVEVKKNIEFSREKYYRLYSQICNIKSPNIGAVGDRKVQMFAFRYIKIAGKNYFDLSNGQNNINSDEATEKLINTLLANNVEYFILPTGKKSKNDSVINDYWKMCNKLSSIGAIKYYSWRGLYEIWHYNLIPVSSDFYKYLSMANPRARIGVYGTNKEIGEEYTSRCSYISKKFNLRIYSLVSNNRDSERNMYYIDRNNLALMLLPMRPIQGISRDKLKEMKQYLKDTDWECVDSIANLGFELWLPKDI